MFIVVWTSLSTQSGNFWKHPRNIAWSTQCIYGVSMVPATSNNHFPEHQLPIFITDAMLFFGGGNQIYTPHTRAVCEVRRLTLLLRVGTLCRCSDGLFFEVLPLASNALLTTLHPLLENVLETVDHFEIFCLRAPFSWLEKPRNRMGRDLKWILCSAWKMWIGGTPLEHPPYSPRPMRFLGFSNHKKGAPRQEISKRSTVCSTFSRSGLSVVRSASLAKGGTSKKRPSPHLHEVPTRSNKVSPRILQTALVLDD
jgi:hypothetical protein